MYTPVAAVTSPVATPISGDSQGSSRAGRKNSTEVRPSTP